MSGQFTSSGFTVESVGLNSSAQLCGVGALGVGFSYSFSMFFALLAKIRNEAYYIVTMLLLPYFYIITIFSYYIPTVLLYVVRIPGA